MNGKMWDQIEELVARDEAIRLGQAQPAEEPTPDYIERQNRRFEAYMRQTMPTHDLPRDEYTP